MEISDNAHTILIRFSISESVLLLYYTKVRVSSNQRYARGGYSHLSNISVITFSLRKDKFCIDLRRQDT